MSRKFVIAGGPGTGKTSIINGLEKRGYRILKEAAREISKKDKRFIGKSILEINKKDFQNAILDFQIKQIKELEKIKNGEEEKEIIFFDRGLGDTLAYYNLYKLKTTKDKINKIKNIKYEKIFVLDFLNVYKNDKLRKESEEEQEKIHEEIIEMYNKLGYKERIITIPFMSVKKRVNFILNKIIAKNYNTSF
mgnify:CR=1 FL=1